MNFIEYLIEQKFTDADGKVKYTIPTKKSSENATEIVNDLKDCLLYMKDHLSQFTISSRNINPATLKYILKIKETSDDHTSDRDFCSKRNIKSKTIDLILNIQNLEKYLSKSECSNNSHAGWIYEFIIPNYFGKVVTVTGNEIGYNKPETRSGSMLYLKFNFLKCRDENGKIIVDQSTIKLDIVSIHPTNRTRDEKPNRQNFRNNNSHQNFYYRKKW